MRSTTLARLRCCLSVSAGQLRLEPESAPNSSRLRSGASSDWQHETSFLLSLAHRLDRYLQPHEVDREAAEVSWQRHLQLLGQLPGQSGS